MRLPIHRVSLLFAWLWLGGLISCDLNKIDFTTNDSLNVQNETVADSYFEDVADMSSTAVSVPSDTQGGKKVFTIADSRFTCALLTLDIADNSTILIPKGLITIDFSSGCADGLGNTRAGKIMINYSGRRFIPGSSITITFNEYKINGVKLDGAYTVSNATGSAETNPKLNVALVSGQLTWPDGTTASRESQYTREWIRTTNGLQDQWLVTGASTGQNRQMQPYSMTITEKLVFQKSCLSKHPKFIASQGKEELIVNPKKIDIDFGNGSCDELVTITINGKSMEVDVSSSH